MDNIIHSKVLWVTGRITVVIHMTHSLSVNVYSYCIIIIGYTVWRVHLILQMWTKRNFLRRQLSEQGSQESVSAPLGAVPPRYQDALWVTEKPTILTPEGVIPAVSMKVSIYAMVTNNCIFFESLLYAQSTLLGRRHMWKIPCSRKLTVKLKTTT